MSELNTRKLSENEVLPVGSQILIVSNEDDFHHLKIGTVATTLTTTSHYGSVTAKGLHEEDGTVDQIVYPEHYRVIVETPVAISGGVKAKRVKYLYVVEDADGFEIMYTGDREYAREVKADEGGKAAGVTIQAYVKVKEIR